MANILDLVKYNADGLIPAVAQDIRTDEVLMLAWMNEESLRKTIETGKVHYFSRSRRKLWLKGETSGHFQKVRSISVDCDGDALLIKVEQTGAACHTGHRSCFYTRFDADKLKEGIQSAAGNEDAAESGRGLNEPRQAPAVDRPETEPVSGHAFAAPAGPVQAPVSGTAAMEDAGKSAAETCKGADSDTQGNAASVVPAQAGGCAGADEAPAGPAVLEEVFGVILDRKLHPREGSYTNYLFAKGLDKILKKIGEEAGEVVIASKNGDKGEIRAEVADLMYHVMVLLAERGMSWDDIYRELSQRK